MTHTVLKSGSLRTMKRFEYVHPAGGNEFTSVKIAPDELGKIVETQGWCDVCKGWEEE